LRNAEEGNAAVVGTGSSSGGSGAGVGVSSDGSEAGSLSEFDPSEYFRDGGGATAGDVADDEDGGFGSGGGMGRDPDKNPNGDGGDGLLSCCCYCCPSCISGRGGQGRKRATCLYLFPVVAVLLYLFVRFYVGADLMQGLAPL